MAQFCFHGRSAISALLATLVVGALRNARRRSAELVDQAQSAHEALSVPGVLAFGLGVAGDELRRQAVEAYLRRSTAIIMPARNICRMSLVRTW